MGAAIPGAMTSLSPALADPAPASRPPRRPTWGADDGVPREIFGRSVSTGSTVMQQGLGLSAGAHTDNRGSTDLAGNGILDGALRRNSFASGDELPLQPLAAQLPVQPHRRHSKDSGYNVTRGDHSEAVAPLACSASVPRLTR